MLENLMVTSAIVAPFCIYLLIGIFLRKWGILSEDLAKDINGLMFKVFMPINIFNSMYKADLSTTFSNPSAPYSMIGTLVVLAILMKIMPLFAKDPAQQGAMVHTGYRGNVMLFALPIAQGIFGDDITEILIILTVVMIANNFSAVPLMEGYKRKVAAYRGESAASEAIDYKEMILNLFKTPILDGVVIGFLWALFKLPLPAVPTKVVSSMAACVTPMAFIIMGARMDFGHLKGNLNKSVLIALIKLVISPAIFLAYPLLAGWGEKLIVGVMVAFASPSAIVGYTMSENYDCDAELAAEIISLTSVLSMLTLFLWIFCFKQFGIIG